MEALITLTAPKTKTEKRMKEKTKKKNEKRKALEPDSWLALDSRAEQVNSLVTTMAGGSWKVVGLCFILNVVEIFQNTLVCGLDNGLALTPPSKWTLAGFVNNEECTKLLHFRWEDKWYCNNFNNKKKHICVYYFASIVGWMDWERFRCNIDCNKDPENCIRWGFFFAVVWSAKLWFM